MLADTICSAPVPKCSENAPVDHQRLDARRQQHLAMALAGGASQARWRRTT
jgi:hypothetical protein